MASWDDEDFEPGDRTTVGNTTWEGEDEDDNDIKDNWDDEEEEKAKEDASKSESKKKKSLIEKIKEKEKRKQETIAKLEEMKRIEEENRELTPEEEIQEKVRRQRLQEESDLQLAKEAFGVIDLPVQKTIDNFVPTNKEEFLELSSMIVQKLSKLELRTEYMLFLETLVRDCCAGFEAEDIKKIANTLNLLVQEKQKQSKVAKGKKKTGASSKKTLSTGKGVNDELDYDDSYYNEYEDFM